MSGEAGVEEGKDGNLTEKNVVSSLPPRRKILPSANVDE